MAIDWSCEPLLVHTPLFLIISKDDAYVKWGEKYSDILETKQQKDSSDGWRNLSGTLQQYDQGKIQDCKEDIDTLLVFVCAPLQNTCPLLTRP